MNTVIFAALLLTAESQIKSENIELKTAAGRLAGALDLPAGSGPWPIVLIHPGSGPTDRDGNQPSMKNDSLKMLGAALAGRGIACLRVDKRGVGGSAAVFGKETDLRFDHYANDVAAWIDMLRNDKRFTHVGFIGHSEGSLIGAVSAQSTKFDAFVSLCGPGQRLSDVLRVQVNGKLTDELLNKNEAILKALEAGKTMDDVPKELAALYRPSVQPFLISMFKYDPAELVGKLTCPALVVTGTTDAQIKTAEGDRLSSGNHGAKHVTIKNMSHVLKETTETDVKAQFKSVYTDPKIPLHPEVAKRVFEFLVTSWKLESRGP